jgi:hypothetical protein
VLLSSKISRCSGLQLRQRQLASSRGALSPSLLAGGEMAVLPQLIVGKALVQHGVSLALGHVFKLALLHVSQTDVFHKLLLISFDSESRSSSFCYQIVVGET